MKKVITTKIIIKVVLKKGNSVKLAPFSLQTSELMLIQKIDILIMLVDQKTFIGNYLYDNSLGVDISPIQIEYAKQNYSNMNL